MMIIVMAITSLFFASLPVMQAMENNYKVKEKMYDDQDDTNVSYDSHDANQETQELYRLCCNFIKKMYINPFAAYCDSKKILTLLHKGADCNRCITISTKNEVFKAPLFYFAITHLADFDIVDTCFAYGADIKKKMIISDASNVTSITFFSFLFNTLCNYSKEEELMLMKVELLAIVLKRFAKDDARFDKIDKKQCLLYLYDYWSIEKKCDLKRDEALNILAASQTLTSDMNNDCNFKTAII